MRYFIASVFLFIGGSTFVFGQNRISGTVTNEKNEPLPGSHIHTLKTEIIVDPAGNFEFTAPDGNNRFVISHIGYKTIDTLVSVDENLELHFRLRESISQLENVIVQQSSPQNNRPTNVTEIKSATIERYSGASLGDVLREVAGVSSLKSGNTIVKPIINGLHSSRVLIINDNVRLEDQQWGLEHAPNLDINTAGKVSVVKGAAGLQYGGDAIGGTVIVEPNKIPVRDTIYGQTIVNGATNGRGGSITSTVSKGTASGYTFGIQGTFKYLGDLDSPDYVLSNTGNRERNFSARFGHRSDMTGFEIFYSYYNAEIGILRAAHTGNITDLVNAINSGEPGIIDDFTYDINAPKQQVQHHLAKVHYHKTIRGLGKLNLQYALQFNNRLEFDIRRGDNRDKPSLDLDLLTNSINADLAIAKDNKSYKVGATALYQPNNASIETGVRPLIPDYVKYDVGLYGIGKFELNSKLELDAGIRYDFSRIDATKFYLKSRWAERNYDSDFSAFVTGDFGTQWKTNPVFTYHNVSASMGLKYQLSRAITWYSNVSIASRNPNPSELFSDGLHHATGQIELGDLRLDKETAVRIATTLSVASQKVTLDVNPYISMINDFILLEPVGLEFSVRGAFPVWEYRQVNARLAGIDVSANWNFYRNLNLKSLFAYVHGTDIETRKPIIDMPPVNFSNTVTFRKNEWNNLVLGLTSAVSLFQNRYPNNDFFADVLVDGEPENTLVTISRPPKGYHLMHFSSEMRFAAFNKSELSVGLNVNNIFNTAYRDYLNRTRFYADDIGRNFTLQLKLKY